MIARYPLDEVAAALAKVAFNTVVALPVAILGAVLNFVPFTLVELVSRRFDDEQNQIATYKVFPGIVAYPATWGIEAAVAWGLWGGASALAMLVVAPLAGYIAVRLLERQESLWKESRAFLLLRRRKRIAEELRARRAEAGRQIETLVELWVDAQAFAGQQALVGFRVVDVQRRFGEFDEAESGALRAQDLLCAFVGAEALQGRKKGPVKEGRGTERCWPGRGGEAGCGARRQDGVQVAWRDQRLIDEGDEDSLDGSAGFGFVGFDGAQCRMQ